MKTSDIILEAIELDRAIPIDLKNNRALNSRIRGEVVGSGVQATAFHTGQGTVTKVASIDPDVGLRDNYIQFLKQVLEHQDNPFFPKIYNAKIFKDKNDPNIKWKLVVQMEKLTPIDSTKLRGSILQTFKNIGFDSDDIHTVVYEIDQILDHPTSDNLNELARKSRNPKFVEAVTFLRDHMKRNHLMSDMHGGNWMVRLTGHGPQLVIIDPYPPS